MARRPRFYVVLVTCPTLREARKIARAIVPKRLAACANITSSVVESVYTWKGKLENSREHLLIIKTTAARLAALQREVLRLHSYQTPEFLVLPVSTGSAAYLSWLSQQTKYR